MNKIKGFIKSLDVPEKIIGILVLVIFILTLLILIEVMIKR